MLPYWLLFGIPAFASLFERRYKKLWHKGEPFLFLVAVALVGSFIGLRYQVGGDWNSYVRHLALASTIDFEKIPTIGDPGYVLLNWLVAKWGGDVWLVNLACAGLFCWGLFAFAKDQPRPWLALATAVPYLVVVVAMGYTRQGVAIGLAMRGLVALGGQKSNLRFVLWVLAAATFHKSAILLIPISALAENRGRWWTAFWVGGATILSYFTLLERSVDNLIYGYIDREYDSGGAIIRIAMNSLPAVLLILFRDRFEMPQHEKRIWIIASLLALALVPALVFSPSSTAVDRIGLYLIPLQLVVLSRIPDAFGKSEQNSRFLGFVVASYSGFVLYTWLNFASHAHLWVPYQMYFM
ncbi:EpsG family protein [Mesorhizobium sp. M0959]|uniref:EpsG family protein n=1 Tax=unclassified Mesorhizobium TaxID=325217 RepID=UPI003337E679